MARPPLFVPDSPAPQTQAAPKADHGALEDAMRKARDAGIPPAPTFDFPELGTPRQPAAAEPSVPTEGKWIKVQPVQPNGKTAPDAPTLATPGVDGPQIQLSPGAKPVEMFGVKAGDSFIPEFKTGPLPAASQPQDNKKEHPVDKFNTNGPRLSGTEHGLPPIATKPKDGGIIR